ncbi:MAG: glycosyltransferase family 39 protein [Myxococcales bacterium]|nr:glycosyltransferase family 39 protein [Myxococcales bacterium]
MSTASMEYTSASRLRLALAALLAVALVLRLRVAWADLYTLILDVTSDDAYYYFQIARNLAGGDGVTFDGETPTNGFHPLWLVLLTPVAALGGDPVETLHRGLSLSALFGTATVYAVYASVRTLTQNAAAGLAAASFTALHPALVRESVNGLETGLSVCLISWVVLLFLRAASEREPPRMADYAWLGVASGLMMLARTDTCFVLPPLALFFFARERGRRRFASAVAIGAPALLVLGPWIAWSLASFGTLVQISGVAIADFERQAWLAREGGDLAAVLGRAWEVTRASFFSRLMHLYFVPLAAPTGPFFVGAGGLLAFLLLAPLPQRARARRQIGLVMVPGSGILFGLLVHSAVRWWLREWYFAPAALLGALLLGVAVAHLHGVLRDTRFGGRAVVALYALFAAGLAVAFGPPMAGRWGLHSPHRVNQLEAARWIDAHTEPDARVGSFNAGILGYFSNRRVVNLDGVVNEAAYRAKVEQRLPAYVRAMRLDYVADLLGALRPIRCGEHGDRPCETVAVVGERVRAFGGGRIHILATRPAD